MAEPPLRVQGVPRPITTCHVAAIRCQGPFSASAVLRECEQRLGPLRNIAWGRGESPYYDPGSRQQEKGAGEKEVLDSGERERDTERQRQRETQDRLRGGGEAAVSFAPGFCRCRETGRGARQPSPERKGAGELESCG